MFVLVSRVELHLPAARSLKAKRSVITSLVRLADQMHGVACAEVDHQDVWQRSTLGVSAVAGTVGRAEKLMDDVDRLIWSRHDIEVVSNDRTWWEDD